MDKRDSRDSYPTSGCRVGDDVVAALVEYARLLADTSGADSVTMHAVDSTGQTVDATFLLRAASVLLRQSSSLQAEPLTTARRFATFKRIDAINRPTRPQAIVSWETRDYDMDGSP